MIPHTTLPMTKLVRTTEGVLVILANIALVLVPILTTALPVKTAAILGASLDAVTMLSRSIVKAFAVNPAPVPPVQITVPQAPPAFHDRPADMPDERSAAVGLAALRAASDALTADPQGG